MIIDQANAAAESNGLLFNKTSRFESIRPKRIRESILIVNRNAEIHGLSISDNIDDLASRFKVIPGHTSFSIGYILKSMRDCLIVTQDHSNTAENWIDQSHASAVDMHIQRFI